MPYIEARIAGRLVRTFNKAGEPGQPVITRFAALAAQKKAA